ncbi:MULTISPECIES: FAD-dependent oxidoreductase [Bacillus]|uniref:Glutamate synthase n=2 Tax=Bacillus TaxID=1386 RepID=A0A0M5JHG7_9BACI|nr:MULTISPECIES: FAD-dependent monooxygenase [Bacillus]ALC83914.1 glutamate synthase [Bacillus gobiensis]MBP1083023.1 flavin-dependent dehydrogenase [Bacillus capparidis]MED1098004.1 FAD-dependent monooxygenase [Bacillus capparidis]
MREKAVVIGSGIAGKLAAKALSHSFQQVIIVEADKEYKEKVPRKRVPQSYHPHVLLKRGEEAIEILFPGIVSQLIEDGSIVTNPTKDLKWHHFGYWKKRFSGELIMLQLSRPMLEWHLQRRVEEVPNIITRYETKTEQLLVNKHDNTIKGVRLRSLKSGLTEELDANLVVDASGSSSKSIDWLQALDVKVKEEKVKIQLFYATRLYSLKKQEHPEWQSLIISPSIPDNPYGAFIQTLEENRFSVTYSGYANAQAPKTNEEFISYAKKLPVPDVLQFLEGAEPLSEIKIHRVPYQVRRRFDLAKNIPDGFLIIGDAHCRFDPLFGQGMSVAAMQALELKSSLLQTKKADKGFSQSLHKKISKIIDVPWEMATTEALRHPEVKGARTFVQPYKQWYSKRVYELSASEPEIYIRLVRVINLIRSPLHLYHPKVLFPILTNHRHE